MNGADEWAGRSKAGRVMPVFLVLFFAGAFVYLYLRTFLLSGVPLVAHEDQILFFARAVRLVHGQVLYRDFFELVPPGTDLLYAAGFRVFGIHAWLIQAWCIAPGLALVGVVTAIAGRMFRGPLILLPGLLFLVFDFESGLVPTHHWYSTLAAMGAIYVLSEGASTPRVFAAGGLCGVATLFTQTQGTLFFLAVAIYVLWLGKRDANGPSVLRRLSMPALPFVLIVGGVLGYYVHKAGFRTLSFDLVVFPLRYLSSGEFNSPRAYLRQLPSLHSAAGFLRLIPFAFIYVLVPYVYPAGFFQLWRRRRDLPFSLLRQLVLLHLAGIALFLAVASGPRFFRLCTVAPPAVLICVWLVSGESAFSRFARRLLLVLGAVFAMLMPAYRQMQRYQVVDLPIGETAFADPLEAEEFAWMAQRTHPSDLFFNQSALEVYLALRNPTASQLVNYDDFTRPEQVTAILAALERNPPRFIVLDPEESFVSNSHDHSAPFRNYVHAHYHLARRFPRDRFSRDEEVWELGPGSGG